MATRARAYEKAEVEPVRGATTLTIAGRTYGVAGVRHSVYQPADVMAEQAQAVKAIARNHDLVLFEGGADRDFDTPGYAIDDTQPVRAYGYGFLCLGRLRQRIAFDRYARSWIRRSLEDSGDVQAKMYILDVEKGLSKVTTYSDWGYKRAWNLEGSDFWPMMFPERQPCLLSPARSLEQRKGAQQLAAEHNASFPLLVLGAAHEADLVRIASIPDADNYNSRRLLYHV